MWRSSSNSKGHHNYLLAYMTVLLCLFAYVATPLRVLLLLAAQWYSLSDNLTHWQPRQLIRYISGSADKAHGRYSYASLLDGSSGDPSFGTVGSKGQLFFSKLRALTGGPLDGYETDTIRQSIEFV